MIRLALLIAITALSAPAHAESSLTESIIESLKKQRAAIDESLEILSKRQDDRRAQLAKQLATLTQMRSENKDLLAMILQGLVTKHAEQVRDTAIEEQRLQNIADDLTSEISSLTEIPLAIPALGSPVPQGNSVWKATPGMTSGGTLRFSAQSAVPVRAAATGTIVRVEKLSGDTYIVLIDHGRFTTIYSGVLPRTTEIPMPVDAGAAIGHIGPEGLGFEVRANFGPSGIAIDPRVHLR